MLRYDRFRKLLFRLDPENAHKLTLFALRFSGAVPYFRNALRQAFSVEREALKVRAFGLEFANPVGLAAGYDKDGRAMHGLACLGFGHLELGTVTLRPQAGNPRPRIFRLTEDEGLINRMGFPNNGAPALLDRLSNRPPGVVLGVNIGKSKDTAIEHAGEDYLELMNHFYGIADYLAVNVSSPNTIGLRQLQGRDHLTRLLGDLSEAGEKLHRQSGKRCPILVKLAPDLANSELQDAVEIIVDTRMDGLILANTTTSKTKLRSPHGEEVGGLSGRPLFSHSTEMIRSVRSKFGNDLPIIGVGGVFGAEEAREKLLAGADLVQIYTGMVYRGPGIVREILNAWG